jgi:hypothetical protein
MASLLLSERAPPDWGLYPELATMVDRRGTSTTLIKAEMEVLTLKMWFILFPFPSPQEFLRVILP